MGFLSSIFTGSNPTLDRSINQAGSISGYGQNLGEGDSTAASTYYRGLLSGDPSLEATALAPQISAQQAQDQAAKQSASQFGTRSGGVGGYNASIDASGRGNIISALGGLRSGAAGNLASIGSNMLNLGLNANQTQADESQQRLQDQRNSLLGQGISSGVGTLESYGLGKLPGMPGGGSPTGLNGLPSAASRVAPYVNDGAQQISQMSPTSPFAPDIPYQTAQAAPTSSYVFS